MFILEERYGNDGYAFWFKLLEMLGGTEGHVIDLNNPTNAEYLRSKTRRSYEQMMENLNLLATLDAIDPQLWTQKIIWCQKFVDGISDVYIRSRHTETPRRPDNYAEKPRADSVSTTKNPQSRVKESRVKKSIFIPPTLEEVSGYCFERNNGINPQHFIDSNTAKGWVTGKLQTPIKDWKAVVRTWENNSHNRNTAEEYVPEFRDFKYITEEEECERLLKL
jgi:hypothetical protein